MPFFSNYDTDHKNVTNRWLKWQDEPFSYMLRNWTQQFPFRNALHIFWIWSGSQSISRKMERNWNGLVHSGEKSVQFLFWDINEIRTTMNQNWSIKPCIFTFRNAIFRAFVPNHLNFIQIVMKGFKWDTSCLITNCVLSGAEREQRDSCSAHYSH